MYATVVVLAAAAGITAVALSMRGHEETSSPRPYEYVDVLSVFNATGIRDFKPGPPTGLRNRELPGGYSASLRGGGNWSADVFEDVSSAAAHEKRMAESLAESLAAWKKMLTTNTTEPQWSSATAAAESWAAQERRLAEWKELRAVRWSIARCANVVVGGVGHEPKRVCEALAKHVAAAG